MHRCSSCRARARHDARNECVYFNTLSKTAQDNGALMYAGTLLARAARLCPGVIALICKNESITYRHLYDRACTLSRLLAARGVKPRDRVLIFVENSIEFYVAYFAAWQLGAVVVPLNIFLQPHELAHIVSDAQPSLIICSAERMASFQAIEVTHIPLITEQDFPAGDPSESENFESVCLDEHEMAALLYTSGTTGLPKGVMLSSHNIMINLLQGMARLQITDRERVIAILPLFHSFAQFASVWAPFFMCCTVIIVPKIERRAILDGLKHNPTFFMGVPALYGMLCLLRTAPVHGIKYFICGGDALSDKVRGAFELIYRRKICCGYGLTETTPLISVDFSDELMPTHNVGRPCLGIQVEIRDEQGRQLARHEIGRIWVHGPNVMLGYYNAPDATAQVMKNGWFDTGDMGYLDEQGRIVITGRLKDLIIHKGFNIYPPEIENVILGHPNVLMAAVVGQHDEQSGEVPVAFVQMRTAQDNLAHELKTLCQQRLAHYKIPRTFFCSVDALPMTTTNKIDKKVLRKKLEHKH